MSFTGISGRIPGALNIENPAGITSTYGPNHMFDFGISYSSLNQQNSSEEASLNALGLNSLNYWFRVSPKTALTVGITKMSDASFDILDTNDRNEVLGNTDSRYIGEGGASDFYFSLGHSLNKNLHLGVKSSFLFGSQLQTEYLISNDGNTELILEDRTSFIKAFIDFGLQYELELGNGKKLTLGAVYGPGANTRTKVESNILIEGVDSLESERNESIFIPQKRGVGLGLKLNSWQFLVDYEFENWGKNQGEESFSYRNKHSFSTGIQFQKDRASVRLAERMTFNAGFGVQSNYVVVNETDFLNYQFSFGIGIPLNLQSFLNIGYSFSRSGTTANNLFLERAHELSLNISMRDLWFKKRTYD